MLIRCFENNNYNCSLYVNTCTGRRALANNTCMYVVHVRLSHETFGSLRFWFAHICATVHEGYPLLNPKCVHKRALPIRNKTTGGAVRFNHD